MINWQAGLGIAIKYSAVLFYLHQTNQLSLFPVILLVDRILSLNERSINIIEKSFDKD